MARPPADVGRWTARPKLAMLVRALVLAVPIAIALAVAVGTAMLVPVSGSRGMQLLWWLAVLGASTVALVLTDRLARRALPLAVLLELSLVFPDKAPSRLRAARTGSVAQMERTLDRLRQQGTGGPAIEAAETLVVLVGILGLHDKRTRGHSERVRALTDLLTCELDLDEDERAKVRWAALVHDLGKLKVPVSVLNGGKDLADDDWETLRRHPEEGQRLAGGFVPWLGEWGRTIVEHHERWDGGGYPYGLSGEQISLGARIVAVADSFEVMTAARSYAPARSASAARAELARCAGTQFDPAIVRAFLGISVSRLTWVLGPLTWAVQVPVVASVDKAGQLVKAASVAGIAAGILGTGWVTVPELTPWAPPRAEAADIEAGGTGAGVGRGAGASDGTGTSAAGDEDAAVLGGSSDRTGTGRSGDGGGSTSGSGTDDSDDDDTDDDDRDTDDDRDDDSETESESETETDGDETTAAAAPQRGKPELRKVLESELRRDAAIARRGPAPGAGTPPVAPPAPPAPPAEEDGDAAGPNGPKGPAAPGRSDAAPPRRPVTPASPATPAQPGGPGQPAQPATPARPASPAQSDRPQPPPPSGGEQDGDEDGDEDGDGDEVDRQGVAPGPAQGNAPADAGDVRNEQGDRG